MKKAFQVFVVSMWFLAVVFLTGRVWVRSSQQAEQVPLPATEEIFVCCGGQRIIRLCDEGNLIYYSPGGRAHSMAVVEGGCQ